MLLDQVLANLLDNVGQVRRPGCAGSASAPVLIGRIASDSRRGWRSGRPGRCAPAAVREVLPGTAIGRGVAAGHRHRAWPSSRGLMRGHGRVTADERSSADWAVWPSSCHGVAARQPGRPRRPRAPTTSARRSCSSRTTRRHGGASPRSSAATVTSSARPPTATTALASLRSARARTSSCSTSGLPDLDGADGRPPRPARGHDADPRRLGA